MPLSRSVRWTAPLVFGLIGLFGSGCSYATVGSGQVGVVWTPEGVNPKTFPEGEWSIGPSDHASLYNTRSQEQAARLDVLAANGLRIELDTSIRFHIVAAEAVQLHKELGENYYATLVGPTLMSEARRVVGRYAPEEIYSTQREVIETQIRDGVAEAIKGRHIVLEAVLIRNVTLPDPIQAAINTKLEAEQQALKVKFLIAEAQADAEKQKIEVEAAIDRDKLKATAAAENDRIGAQGAADAKRIEAQATDDYARIVGQHLSEMMLRWQEIQATSALASATNSKVVVLGNPKANPILDVK